jgi:hypothetical protein
VNITNNFNTSIDIRTRGAEDEIEASPVVIVSLLYDNRPSNDILLHDCSHDLFLGFVIQSVELEI